MSGRLDLRALDWRGLFLRMHPGFFEKPSIAGLPAGRLWEEMALDLGGFSPEAAAVSAPEGARFGLYGGDMDALREAVRRVDAYWPELFDGKHRVYCGYEGGELASFCLVEDMGVYDGLRIGGPGCVGTLPEHRRRGIGLKMVLDVTALLKAEGYDLSYIHYTGVAPWYARLGYETVLRWSGAGFEEGNG